MRVLLILTTVALGASLLADRVPVKTVPKNPSVRSVSFQVDEQKQAITFLYLVDDRGFERVGVAFHAVSFTDKLALNAITGYDLQTSESWTVGTTLSFRAIEWNGGGLFLHAGVAGTNVFTNDPLVLRPIFGVGVGTTWR
jgi:hypothetical protein